MYVDLNIFIILIWAVIFLSFISAVLLSYCFKFYRSIEHLKKSEDKLEGRMHQKTDVLMEQAFIKADQIIENTEKEAAKAAADHLGKGLASGLEEILKEEAVKMRTETLSSLKQFDTLLATQTVEAKQKLDSEIAAKKEAAMAEIDKKTLETVDRAYREILGKSINLKEHEQLVKDALDKAKKEIFS